MRTPSVASPTDTIGSSDASTCRERMPSPSGPRASPSSRSTSPGLGVGERPSARRHRDGVTSASPARSPDASRHAETPSSTGRSAWACAKTRATSSGIGASTSAASVMTSPGWSPARDPAESGSTRTTADPTPRIARSVRPSGGVSLRSGSATAVMSTLRASSPRREPDRDRRAGADGRGSRVPLLQRLDSLTIHLIDDVARREAVGRGSVRIHPRDDDAGGRAGGARERGRQRLHGDAEPSRRRRGLPDEPVRHREQHRSGDDGQAPLALDDEADQGAVGREEEAARGEAGVRGRPPERARPQRARGSRERADEHRAKRRRLVGDVGGDEESRRLRPLDHPGIERRGGRRGHADDGEPRDRVARDQAARARLRSAGCRRAA